MSLHSSAPSRLSVKSSKVDNDRYELMLSCHIDGKEENRFISDKITIIARDDTNTTETLEILVLAMKKTD